MKDPNVSGAIGVAAACTIILMAMFITVIVKRNESDIRMLQYTHMAAMCFMSMVAIWALVFLWQADMNQAQCSSYLWLTYIPISFVVNTMNMKVS